MKEWRTLLSSDFSQLAPLSGLVNPELSRLLSAISMPLVRTEANMAMQQFLQGKTESDLFPGAGASRAAMAGIYLAGGDWSAAHQISQDLASEEGSFWHAIVHRQEPDAFNSKYWFHRVRNHPVFLRLGPAAQAIDERWGGKLRLPERWDPDTFVGRCEQVRGTPLESAAREVQHAEWTFLMEHCLTDHCLEKQSLRDGQL